MTRQVALEGPGVHLGVTARVTVTARPGAITLRANGLEARLEELQIAATARATTVEAHGGKLRVRTVEHLFAALAGLGVHSGVAVEIEGPEMPLLDGGAIGWWDAIARLEVEPTAPRLRVAREAVISCGASRFAFSPGPAPEIEVRVEFDDVRIAESASWAGARDDFRARIAPARTFALARDVEELSQLGLARHVDRASVVFIAPDAIHHAGRPFAPDEPARHKLLDLVGDLFLFGGPPLGRVRAFRPGHAANARAIRIACDEGVLVANDAALERDAHR